jgi:hypothetical protein
MANKRDIPLVYPPDNEPYLGLASLLWFDRIICWASEGNTQVAMWTQANSNSLTPLQKAACQIIPQGIGIALSLRELIRQAYLFSSLVLIRPLIERAAIISYLDVNPAEVALWENGWRHSQRPSLAKMMDTMSGIKSPKTAQQVVSEHNHIVHGDPYSCRHNIVELSDDTIGYASGKILNNPALADAIAMEAQCYLVVLAARMSRIFPQVIIPHMPSDGDLLRQ